MAHDARDAIGALRRSHDEMAAMVARMGPGELGRQSACSEWPIAQVLSHLGSGAEIGLASLQSGRNDPAVAPAVWDRWNAMSPTEQASSFVAADARYVEALEALDAGTLASATYDLGFLPEPVGADFVTALRCSEVALHRWDIEVLDDPGATVGGFIAPYVLEALEGFVGFFAKPSGATGTVAVHASAPDRRYLLELTAEGATMQPVEAEPAEATTSLTLPGEALARLIAGRLDAAHTPSTVRIEGDVTLDELRRCFPGY